MLIITVPAYFERDRCVDFCIVFPGATTTGRGEPGGLVVERDLGLRPAAALEPGVGGGGMPLTSALLETLWDFLLLEPAIFPRELVPLMSGEWSGWMTVVASSTRSPNIESENGEMY